MGISRGQVKHCPMQAEKAKCGFSFGACAWGGIGMWLDPVWEKRLPRAFSQHDHLCKGQENLDLEACFIYSFLTAALL